MKKSLKDYIQFWQKYIEIERNAEKSQHIQEIYNLGPKREKKWKAILQLKWAILQLKWKVMKNLDDIALIRFGKKQNFETEIKEQDIVVFVPEFFYKFRQEPLNKFAEKLEQMPLGTVDYVWKQFVDVWVNKPFPTWLTKSYVDMHLFVNDVTFKRQQEALTLLPKILKIDEKLRIDDYMWDRVSGKIQLKKRQKIKNLDKLPEKLEFFNKGLNEYQIDFVKKSLAFKYFLLLHGPFGTGKTTTLVEAILQNYKVWNKILVSADSNTAVDNILVRLVNFNLKEWKIVRVGPYTRLVEKFDLKIPVSIYDLMEKHHLNKKLRQLDIQLDKLRKQQDAYKKPVPSLKRWMSEDQIHHYAMLKRSYRWINAKIIVSMSNWLKIQEQINEIISEKEFVKQKIQDDILDNAKIVLATNSMCFSDFLKWRKFDLAIIDEWTQATEPSTLLPVILSEKFIIAWDHKQLPPTVLSDEAEPLKKSMFERLIEWVESFKGKDYLITDNSNKITDNKSVKSGKLKVESTSHAELVSASSIVEGDNFCDNNKIICDNVQEDVINTFYIMLQIQYRMNEKLMQFPNKMFYSWKLKAAESVRNITLKDLVWEKKWKILDSNQVLYWLDVKWKQKIDDNKSIYNLEEIKKVVDVVEELLNMWVAKQDIWVISPYSAQVFCPSFKIKKCFVRYRS